jgi:hypothetical protein
MTTSNAPARRDQNAGRAIQLPSGARADRVGQGTAVEQSRATSEVYYRVAIAKEMPRDEDRCIEQMRRACSNMRLAQKAFYSVPRAGGTVDGTSVHLARELARIWGNLDYGVTELRQDDEYAQSEMQAFAWDLETNTRSVQTFIVPHKRDTKRGAEKLTSMADIYNSNANNGAKRVRQAIFAILPDAFTAEAEELCRATLAKGDGTALADRVAKAVKLFESRFAVTVALLEANVGRPRDKWTAAQVADLQILYRSLEKKEITVAEAFPGAKVTGDEITDQAAKRTTATATTQPPADTPADEPPAEQPPLTDEQQWALDAQGN